MTGIFPRNQKKINKPYPDSYEDIFNHCRYPNFLLDLRGDNEAIKVLSEPRLQRAIGVIYRPDTERQSHYFYATLPRQFDFILHYKKTSALTPLDEVAALHKLQDIDETYPFGL